MVEIKQIFRIGAIFDRGLNPRLTYESRLAHAIQLENIVNSSIRTVATSMKPDEHVPLNNVINDKLLTTLLKTPPGVLIRGRTELPDGTILEHDSIKDRDFVKFVQTEGETTLYEVNVNEAELDTIIKSISSLLKIPEMTLPKHVKNLHDAVEKAEKLKEKGKDIPAKLFQHKEQYESFSDRKPIVNKMVKELGVPADKLLEAIGNLLQRRNSLISPS